MGPLVRLGFVIPTDCSASYLLTLLEPRRAPVRDDRVGGPALTVVWNGTEQDREAARVELAAALADAGSLTREVRFTDELA